MHIKELFDHKRVVFSYEIFPPKVTSPIETIYSTIEALSDLKPDYMSVTYGSGGSTVTNRTCELSALVKNKYGIEALAHLTCISSNKEIIDGTLKNLEDSGIDNILALRGDIPKDALITGNFKNAYELIEYIKSISNFGVSAACYPEGHIESKSLDHEIEAFKRKVEAGADYFITQLFFDNNYFYNFLNRVHTKNINVPIEAGIMPVINKKQIETIVSMCGTSIPQKFMKIMDKYGDDKEALRDAGIAYAIDQIVDLISTGVRGIHLYTMNNPYVARKITEAVSSVLNSINKTQVI